MISLNTLSGLISAESVEKCVYAVENAGVFGDLVRRISRSAKLMLVCTGGQPHLATLVLLDLLCRQGCNIYYAGDFDPEGLRIAQNLKNRYGDALEFWHYEKEAFMQCISEVLLTQKRLKKLDKLEDEKLVLIGELIKLHGKVAYQENLIDWYMKDMGR